MKQQIILSGTGGQGILFLTRFFAEAALENGLDVLTSENHGMAMRGGTVVSHVKVGSFTSPLVRWGHADAVLIMSPENLALHEGFIRPDGTIFVNTILRERPFSIDASGIAARLGKPAISNMALLGYAISSGKLFCNESVSLRALERISSPGQCDSNTRVFMAGLEAGFDKS